MTVTHGVLITWNFQSASSSVQATFVVIEAPLVEKHRKSPANDFWVSQEDMGRVPTVSTIGGDTMHLAFELSYP